VVQERVLRRAQPVDAGPVGIGSELELDEPLLDPLLGLFGRNRVGFEAERERRLHTGCVQLLVELLELLLDVRVPGELPLCGEIAVHTVAPGGE
jgi:hypothetical protein